MMSLLDLFRPKCPDCHRRGLRGHPDRQVLEGQGEGLRANPAWLWWE